MKDRDFVVEWCYIWGRHYEKTYYENLSDADLLKEYERLMIMQSEIMKKDGIS